MWLKTLADTACGTLLGREKIMLETYVQTAYFERGARARKPPPAEDDGRPV